MLTPRDVTVDAVLSNLSVAYRSENLIAEKIFPMIDVTKQSGKYYIFDKSSLRANKTRRAAGSPSNEVEHGLTTTSYLTEDHALKEKIPYEVIDQAESSLNPEMDAVEAITEMLAIDKEVALATAMANTSIMTSNTTLSGTSQWSDYTNSNPFGDIMTGIAAVQAAIGRRPNTLILGQQTFNILINHPDIVERVKYSMAGSVTESLLASLFNVSTVLIGSALQNTANEGQADSLSFVWGKHAWLAYITPSARLKQVTLGYHLQYKGRKVEKWEDVDAQSRWVRVGDNYAQEFVAPTAGYLIKNAVA